MSEVNDEEMLYFIFYVEIDATQDHLFSYIREGDQGGKGVRFYNAW